MALRPWKKIRQAFEMRNPWWTYRQDEVLTPSGRAGEYHFVHVHGSSMIIPVLDDGRVVLVNQHRYLADRESLEFPCGSVKDGATYEETAHHELAEETGFAARELTLVAQFNPYNGVTDEMCRVYLARGLTPLGAAVQPDETEEFEIVHLAPREIEQRVASGAIWDGMTLAAWAVTRERLS